MGNVPRLALLVSLTLSASAGRADDFTWAKQLGGSNYDRAESIAVDATGNVYTTGYFYGAGDFDPGPGTSGLTSAGEYDAFVSKLDASGNFAWARHLGGDRPDYGRSIAVDGAGNVYLAGRFTATADFDPGPGTYDLTSAGGLDVFVVKLDGAGNFVWARSFGGPADDSVQGLAVDVAGNAVTTGTFIGTADFDPGAATYALSADGPLWPDVFVSKLDGSGQFVWAKRFGGTSEDFGQAVAVDRTGAVYTTGSFYDSADFDPGPGVFLLSSTGGSDVFVSKLDAAGNFLWAKQIGGTGYGAQGYAIAVDAASFVYIAGSFDGIIDFDPGPGVDERTSFGGDDVFVSKLDPAGNAVWARQLGSDNYDAGRGIAVDGAGNVYASGWFTGVGDFDPGSEVSNLTSAGGDDAFVSKLDASGTFVWAKRIGGTGEDHGNAVAADRDGGAYAAGSFWDTVDFDPGPNVYALTALGRNDAFVWKRAERCGPFVDDSRYGTLVYPRMCTRDANELPGIGGESYLYETKSLAVHRAPGDTFYLSSSGNAFAKLIVDDWCFINGLDSTLGGYPAQPGVPPFQIGVPIEDNFMPQFPPDVTAKIPAGTSTVLFEAYDVWRQVYGHTPVYLMRDCGIRLSKGAPGQTTIHFMSFAVDIDEQQNDLRVITGRISELRADAGFARATCLATVIDSQDASDSRPDPPAGDAHYYLARGTCSETGYGKAEGISPDPRDYLVTADPCP